VEYVNGVRTGNDLAPEPVHGVDPAAPATNLVNCMLPPELIKYVTMTGVPLSCAFGIIALTLRVFVGRMPAGTEVPVSANDVLSLVQVKPLVAVGVMVTIVPTCTYANVVVGDVVHASSQVVVKVPVVGVRLGQLVPVLWQTLFPPTVTVVAAIVAAVTVPVNVGDADSTTEPVPVELVTPVPPLPTPSVPVTSAVRLTAPKVGAPAAFPCSRVVVVPSEPRVAGVVPAPPPSTN
jgi:hypothetical protein